MENNEWLEFIEKNEDCPENIFKSAKTPWEKLVAVEFFKYDKRCQIIEEKISNHEKLLYAILGVTSVATIGIVVKFVIDYCLKVIP